MIEIALLFIVAVTAFGMGFMSGQAWQGKCEELLRDRSDD